MTPGPLVPRVALVMPYWDFFEGASSIDLRADRTALLEIAATDVESAGTLLTSHVLERPEQVDDVVQAMQRTAPDVVLVLVTMACPPLAMTQVLSAAPDISVVVWAADPSGPIDRSFSHADIVRRGASVGTPMLTSELVSQGRAFSLLTTAPGDPAGTDVLARALRCAATATRVRRSRVGRIGVALPGYTSVDDSDENLHRGLGLEVASLPPSTLEDGVRDTTPEEVTAWQARRAGSYEWPDAADQRHAVAQSARAGAALERVMTEHRLDAGTLNCHTPQVRGSDAIGFAPCLALGSATSQGRPWTCTGDILTAIAMLIGSLLTGTSLYHEIEAHDDERDDWVLANSGEHDLRWSPTRNAVVANNPWWPEGLSARHGLTEGPCTLLAVRRRPSGHALVVAEGQIGADQVAETGTVNGRFTFSEYPAPAAWRRWVLAGAGHHSCLSRGHVAAQLQEVAHHLGVSCEVVTGSGDLST